MSLTMMSCVNKPEQWQSEQFDGKTFNNQATSLNDGSENMANIFYRFMFEDRKQRVPQQALPMQPLDLQLWQQSQQDLVARLGHSSVLLKLDGGFWLTDPVFSKRASPVQWAGPKRFHQPPVTLEQLPELTAIVISHDHYDHLDKHSVLALADKTERFIAPLGVGQRLIDWGVPADKVTELDWWQEYQHAGVTVAATPAQHFSGRSLRDRNQTLWASFVLQGQQSKVFFSGDGGYFGGFKEIGERYGPFDLTLMETGAYDESWASVHMLPEQSVQAHLDVRGEVLLPIHNSTFNLAFHPWQEPLQRVQHQAERSGVSLWIPMIGETRTIGGAYSNNSWWEQSAETLTQLTAVDGNS
ncbi:MBL fold metallo-hydrolase [Aliagarivorans marinus]|uniref:MBL fold metallo-hydrolase n=1 Tax=Aliagarivorans marinus TaxID=561965 RepID=UPI0006884D89|nr:MBL fold metallo-hydrolase [Aliagarivorans marinus]